MATIATNSIDAQYPEVWSSAMQSLLQKQLVGMDVASTKFEETLDKGDRVNVPYFAPLTSSSYTPGEEVDPQNLTSTNDFIDIDTSREVSFYVDDLEKVKSKYAFKGRVKDAVHQLRDDMDQSIFEEYANATYALDDGDFGGSAGSNVTIDTSNAVQLFSKIKQKAFEGNMEENNLFLVVDPATAEPIERKMTDSGFKIADSTLTNGKVDNIMGVDIYKSNNLPAGHCLAGVKGAISVVKLVSPVVQINKESKATGYTYIIYDLYGIKTLEKGTDRLIDIQVANSATTS